MKSAEEIADIVELQAWALDGPYSQSSLSEDLAALWADPSDENEGPTNLAAEVFEEIVKRSQIVGDGYPFLTDGNIMEIRAERRASSSYLFCLGLEYFNEHVTLALRAREFEAVAAAAARSYFNGESVSIGAPWATEEITDHRALRQLVSNLIPDLGPPTDDAGPGAGDGGWDVVVVSDFSDRHFSRIIALGNCATGLTNWKTKGMEAQVTYFWSLFTRPPQAENVCLTFVAVPFRMRREDRLRKAGPTNIPFDRMRICEHTSVASEAVMLWLNSHKQEAADIPLL